MSSLPQTESLASEIVTDKVDDSIKPSTFTIPWATVFQVLVQILVAVTPFLLKSAGISLLAADSPGTQAKAYVAKRYKKKFGLFNLLLIWRTRHQIEMQAKANNLLLTTEQANDLAVRVLNKVTSCQCGSLDNVIRENLK